VGVVLRGYIRSEKVLRHASNRVVRVNRLARR
jgi:hypothetical protein